jgi:hypothetical protein
LPFNRLAVRWPIESGLDSSPIFEIMCEKGISYVHCGRSKERVEGCD